MCGRCVEWSVTPARRCKRTLRIRVYSAAPSAAVGPASARMVDSAPITRCAVSRSKISFCTQHAAKAQWVPRGQPVDALGPLAKMASPRTARAHQRRDAQRRQAHFGTDREARDAQGCAHSACLLCLVQQLQRFAGLSGGRHFT